MSSSSVPRPQRWDTPLDANMGEQDVARVRALPPFSRIDPRAFPEALPLDGILLNDARVARFRGGDIVVRRGDYGNSAFFVLSGFVQLDRDSARGELSDAMLGRSARDRKGWLASVAQLWSRSRWPEVDAGPEPPDRAPTARDDAEPGLVFLQDLAALASPSEQTLMGPGEWFGEMAALGRTPRAATILAASDAELLEIRWQGLRDIRRRAPEIREHLERLYRERALKTHLKETPMFRHLDDPELERVKEQVEFETHGEFDWYGTYRQLLQRSASERLTAEPLIAEEGHYPNGLILVRSGFARVTKSHGSGQRTLRYLGRGQVYGFEEIAHNWRNSAPIALQSTLRAVGYVDVLRVPTHVVEDLVLPTLPPEQLPTPIAEPAAAVAAPVLEFLVENRIINGSATMLIDLDRCTRCDDCVRACAATHDGNPRFVRHGPVIDRTMVANACMHCADPVCMIGCPTGAIHRDAAGGEVVINPGTCIGCGTCANSCPYDNIRMVEIRDKSGAFLLAEETRAPILKATKCDLCRDQLGGPACARACPHGALKRQDMRDLEGLGQWLAR